MGAVAAGVDSDADADGAADDAAADANSANIFQHVTSLAAADGDRSPTVLAVLAYACIRLAHLSHDAFGDSRAAKRLYKLAAAVDPHPGGVAYHGIGTSVEASVAQAGSVAGDDEERVWREEMEKAVEAYREAIRLGGGSGSSGEVLFHLAVALEVSRMFVAMSVFLGGIASCLLSDN